MTTYNLARMCSIENHEDLCDGMLEASLIMMVPLEQSCGMGAWISASVGAHKKIWRAARVMELGSEAAPMVSTRHPASVQRLRCSALCISAGADRRGGARRAPGGADTSADTVAQASGGTGRLIFLYSSALRRKRFGENRGEKLTLSSANAPPLSHHSLCKRRNWLVPRM